MNPIGQMTHADVAGSSLTSALLQSQKIHLRSRVYCSDECVLRIGSTAGAQVFAVPVAKISEENATTVYFWNV